MVWLWIWNMSLQVPECFTRSYESSDLYPQNLVHVPGTPYNIILQAYKGRLDSAASYLFTRKEEEVFVPFRDLYSTGQSTAIFNPSFLT